MIPVALPDRPADGGGLPTDEAGIRERLTNAPDLILQGTLEREYESERRLRASLGRVRLRIRLMEEERARRRGVEPTQAQDYS